MGLREQLKIMDNPDKILGSVKVALETYEYASSKTKQSWKRTATKRLKELSDMNMVRDVKEPKVNKSNRSRKR